MSAAMAQQIARPPGAGWRDLRRAWSEAASLTTIAGSAALLAAAGPARPIAWVLHYVVAVALALLRPPSGWMLAAVAGGAFVAAAARLGQGGAPAEELVHVCFVPLVYRVLAGYIGDAWRMEQEAALFAEMAETRRDREARLAMAREVHDGLGATLTAAALHAEVALAARDEEPERARRSLERVAELAREGQERLARLGAASEGDAATWAVAGQELVRCAEELCAPGGVEHQVGFAVPGELLLPPGARIALVSGGREVLANAMRHGRPRRVWMRAGLACGALVVSVEDDGAGLGAAPAGYGRAAVCARMQALGGDARWSARAGGGTRVELRLPVEG